MEHSLGCQWINGENLIKLKMVRSQQIFQVWINWRIKKWQPNKGKSSKDNQKAQTFPETDLYIKEYLCFLCCSRAHNTGKPCRCVSWRDKYQMTQVLNIWGPNNKMFSEIEHTRCLPISGIALVYLYRLDLFS